MKRLALICALLPLPVFAQSEDEGRLVRFIEGALSDGAVRSVDLQGFRGALSSEAQLDRLTISDAEGIWLEIEGAVLSWNRAAVLRGEIEISTLSADRVSLTRLPVTEPTGPTPEATPFALPDLPVSINIETAEITRLELGAPVLGMPVAASAMARVLLSGGAGEAQLSIDRIDGQVGRISLEASYDNASTQTLVNLSANEGEGGIAATLLGIEDQPPMALDIAGEGPLDAFDATFALATDGVDRFAGTASIAEAEDTTTRITFDLGGDLRPIVSGDLETFLGEAAEISAIAELNPDGSVELQELRAQSAALNLTGSMMLDPTRAPLAFDLSGDISPPGNAQTLALPGGDAEISGATIALTYDRPTGDTVAGQASLTDLVAQGFSAPQTIVTLDGTLSTDAFIGQISAQSTGLDHADPAIAEALGSEVSLATVLDWTFGNVVALNDLILDTEPAQLTGSLSATPSEGRMDISAAIDVEARDLGPFGPLAGQRLSGSAEGSIEIDLEALSGALETVFTAETLDLSLPDLVPDTLLAGLTALSGRIIRDESGLAIEALDLDGTALSLEVAGALSSAETDMSFAAGLIDAALADPRLSGPVQTSGLLTRTGDAPYLLSDLDLTADFGSLAGQVTALPGEDAFPITADLAGMVRLASLSALIRQDLSGTIDLSLDGEGDLRRETVAAEIAATGQNLRMAAIPPALLAGETRLSGQISLADGMVSAMPLEIAGQEITATLTGQFGVADSDASLTARLRDGRVLSSALPGALSLEAEVAQSDAGPYQITANARGTAGLQAQITGTATAEPLLDLTITGAVPLALADPFIAPQTLVGRATLDMRLRGAPGLDALSGRVTVGEARLGLPVQGLALQNITTRADIAGGSATLDLAGTLSSGGRLGVTGRVGFADPALPADLEISLDQGRFVDPALYEAMVDRLRLTLAGALTGSQFLRGQIDLGVVELRVPETGSSSTGAIPEIRHTGETAAERRTRLYAGLLGQSSGGQSGLAQLGLGIDINAPGRIFLRGRGLDAELGGTLRLAGTAANVIPSGQFELIRGRLSILGQRLDLTEGFVTLQGGDPFVSLTAETQSGEYTIFITVEGNASAPNVGFRSSPDLPEDEVLAQLFFGRSVSSLSAVQALQLADGVASLAGGGSGVFTRLREGLGLDDLDIETDEAGNAAVTAGRYLSDNVYTDVTVGDGGTGVSINIDLTPSLTARGGVDSDGTSSLGVFFERDY